VIFDGLDHWIGTTRCVGRCCLIADRTIQKLELQARLCVNIILRTLDGRRYDCVIATNDHRLVILDGRRSVQINDCATFQAKFGIEFD